jgi:hypothetical protein
MTDNPYIQPENYHAQYQTMQPEKGEVALDELCWHVFNTDDGKKLLEIIEKRFILMGTPGPINDNYGNMCIYYEGFREAFRQILGSVQNYQIRKDQQAKQAAGEA